MKTAEQFYNEYFSQHKVNFDSQEAGLWQHSPESMVGFAEEYAAELLKRNVHLQAEKEALIKELQNLKHKE